MVSSQEVLVVFFLAGYNQGSFSKEGAILFFALVDFLPLFEQTLVGLLLFSNSFFFRPNCKGSSE